MSIYASNSTELEYCRMREAQERKAEAAGQCTYTREAHFEMAERYADRAWALEEAVDGPYQPSGLWDATIDSAGPEPVVMTVANDRWAADTGQSEWSKSSSTYAKETRQNSRPRPQASPHF